MGSLRFACLVSALLGLAAGGCAEFLGPAGAGQPGQAPPPTAAADRPEPGTWSRQLRAGRDHLRFGELEDAESELLGALETAQRFRARDPRVEASTQALDALEHAYQEEERFEDAGRVARLLIDALGDLHGGEDVRLAPHWRVLAQGHRHAERYAEAEDALEHALLLYRMAPEPDSARIADVHLELAQVAKEAERLDDAEAHALEAVATVEESYGESHATLAPVLRELARIHEAQERDAEAEADYQRIVSIYESSYGEGDVRVAEASQLLADFYQERGQHEKANAARERAIAAYEVALGESHPRLAQVLNNHAFELVEQGRYERAEELARRAVDMVEARNLRAATLDTLGEALLGQARPEEATEMYERALDEIAQSSPLDEELLDTIEKNYARALRASEREDEVQAMVARVTSLREDGTLPPADEGAMEGEEPADATAPDAEPADEGAPAPDPEPAPTE